MRLSAMPLGHYNQGERLCVRVECPCICATSPSSPAARNRTAKEARKSTTAAPMQTWPGSWRSWLTERLRLIPTRLPIPLSRRSALLRRAMVSAEGGPKLAFPAVTLRSPVLTETWRPLQTTGEVEARMFDAVSKYAGMVGQAKSAPHSARRRRSNQVLIEEMRRRR